MKMTRIRRLSVILALLPLACSDDTTSEGGTSASGTATETGATMSATDSAETGTASASGDGDGDMTGDGDGDPATASGDGDGDGDGTTTGDDDGESESTGDGDGDGDGDASGDGDGDTSGDGDGDNTGDGDGDGELCGNGMVDPGEACDDGNQDNTDDCTSACELATCGDGFIQDGEECDDGNNINDDGCTDACELPPCDEIAVVLQPTPPNVMLVLDKSGSMFSNTWDHDNNGGTPQITRWNSLYQVVDGVVTTFDNQIRFGANLFPSVQAQNVYGPAACLTSDFPEVTVGPNNANAILGDIPAANTINSYGGTPATIGIDTAANHLSNQNPMNPRVIILVTDGAANCDQGAQNNFQLFEVYDSALPARVADALADDDIQTFVVGIDIANQLSGNGVDGEPNSINPTVELNAVAQAGGTNTFINSQDQIELENALNAIIDSVQSCIIPLENPPFFPDFTVIEVGGVEYEWDPNLDCQNDDGWVYTNDNNDEIELCGAACEALKMSGEADVQYFCNPG